jgi:phage terminase large subunit-like protein
VAPTQTDAVNSCFKGPSGLQILNPSTRMTTSREGTIITWPGGATAVCLGAHSPDDVERFRSAGNRCALWAEELAAWRKLQDAWDIMAFGLRTVGETPPRTVASTTPKAKPVIKALIADPRTAVTRATTADNPHLNEERREQLYAKYGGTRLGRQELGGELIEDVEGALWNVENLDLHRLWEVPVPLKRVVIGVDPTGGRAECGIVAAALGADKRVYVVGDYSVERPSPAVWGARVVSAYSLSYADRIAVERNYGGDMVRHTVRTSPGGDALPIKDVTASRGKQVRAEPISNLFEQGRAVLVGSFPELEAQLTTWVPLDNEPSPDRLDAMVWAITELVPGLLAVPGRGTGRQISEARIGGR